MLRVLCLVPYPTRGASNRLRVEQYARPLRASGIELVISPFFDDATFRVLYLPGHTVAKVFGVLRGIARRIRDVLRARSYPLVLIHRESAPFGPPLVERALARLGVRYIFDFDDAIFLPAIHPANRRWARLRRVNVEETTRRAAAVIAGNAYLADWAGALSPRLTIIPTPVDTDRHVPAPVRSRAGPVVIGWVGSSSTVPYIHLIDRALEELASRNEIVLRVIGGTYVNPAIRVELLPFDVEREPADVAAFDIGLLPEPDDAWTRGKGAFKGLLYMAAGVPVVASAVGVNPEVVGEGGLCATGDPEWVAALERLVRDRGLRERMGDAGRRRVLERYSLSVQAPRFAATIRSAIEGTAGAA
jgi:glycosyltransferase involved in cell wall biosynthesis